jgi:lipopolysaccharide export system permease protein
MLRIERYLFRTAASAFLAILTILTAVIWITQALRQLDLMTDKGQTILVFLTITGLGLPFLCAVIAPVALFNAMLYSLNKLNSDSELIVMSAAGVSPWRLLRPFMALFVLVFLALGALYLEVMPGCFDAIDTLTTRVHADFIANFARPGVFNELESGFVFHYRERGNDGSLRGVFIQDKRDPEQVSTYIAEKGEIVDKSGQSYLLLLKGSTQRPHGEGDSSLVTFDDYAIDLSQFVHANENVARPNQRGTWAMLANSGEVAPAMEGQIRAELFNRFTSPLYAFTAGLIGFAALGEARTTRQGRGWAIGVSVVLFAVIRLVGLAISILLRGKPGVPLPGWIPVMAWVLPLGSTLIALDFIFGGPISRIAGAGRARLSARRLKR